ncbi:hypothetical protein F5Y15DRAFT_68697 [Xylariaceae sp. FL0016]|nr:hypothetical protein F5Y15DRAFT_68697 [Xylariaceae sp. FL0016]
MTAKSPEVQASADLDPVSPSPVHPSSPIMIPTLQDQADNISNMIDPIRENPSLPTEPLEKQDETMNVQSESFATQSHGSNVSHQDEGSSQQAEPVISLTPNISHSEHGGQKESEITAVEEKIQQEAGHLVQHQSDVAAMMQNVPQTTEYTEIPDTSVALPAPDQAVAFSPEGDAIPSTANTVPELSKSQAEPQQHPQPEGNTAASTSGTQAAQHSKETSTTYNSHLSNTSNDPAAIQALVDNITAKAAERDATANPTSNTHSSLENHSMQPIPSLPPKPPMPTSSAARPYVPPETIPTYQAGPTMPGTMGIPPSAAVQGGTRSIAAPGIETGFTSTGYPLNEVTGPLGPTPISYESGEAVPNGDQAQNSSQNQPQQQWDMFLQDERRYVSEAKWDRFPDGSRLFIGNLSSERVPKKEVFDTFSVYGRLAQISLKQAYGFVQYHTVTEGQAAIDNLQGIEVRGRKIHLEVSRVQKKDGDASQRGNKGKRGHDRNDRGRGRRDDYRPNRQQSPQRGNRRDSNSYENQPRGRGTQSGSFNGRRNRGRSRSPRFMSRDEGYRHRSSSPRQRQSDAGLELPRRYGNEVPDVQFLLLHEVQQDFVAWAENAFSRQGLNVHVMFLDPRYSREAVIQRQVIEGVFGVVELDYHSQQSGRIPLQLFDRSAGRNNIKYDQYQDLDPNAAAQLVARLKSQTVLQAPYGNGQFPQAPRYHPPPHHHWAPAHAPVPGLAYPSQPYYNHPAPAVPVPHAVPAPFYPNDYMASAVPRAPGGGGDAAHHVDNIMAQLSRYRH